MCSFTICIYLVKYLFMSFVYLLVGLFLLLSFENSLYILDSNPWSDILYSYIFSHSVACCFKLFTEQRLLILMKPSLAVPSMDYAFGVISKNSFSNPRFKDYFQCFASKWFIVLYFALMSIIIWVIFVLGMRFRSKFLFFFFLSMDFRLLQHYLLESLSFFLWVAFATWSKIHWAYLCGSMSRFSILFLLSMCLLLLLSHFSRVRLCVTPYTNNNSLNFGSNIVGPKIW